MSDPTNISPPTISGSVVEPGTVSANPGVWTPTPVSYDYQWLRETAPGSDSYADVGGSTASTYQTGAADLDLRLKVRVTGNGSVIPPAGPPLMDFRATVPTFMPVGGRNVPGLIEPWEGMVVPAYQNSDITVVTDATWGKAFQVRINKNSHNPWFTPASGAVSGEMQFHQTFTNPDDVWYAQSIHWVSGEADLPANVADGWMLFDQLAYLGITSPALGLELRANGLGLDRNPGSYDGSTTPPSLIVRAQALRPLSDFQTGYVDILLHVKWSTAADGVVELFSRKHTDVIFSSDYSASSTVTFQTDHGSFVATADEKQGGYSGTLSPLGPPHNLNTFQFLYLLRGITKHANRTDAEAALA